MVDARVDGAETIVFGRCGCVARAGAGSQSLMDRTRDLLLGPTMAPEGRHQDDEPATLGHQGAFPLHAVPRGTTQGVCGAPVGDALDAHWPPSQESRCEDCERVLAADDDPRLAEHPHGRP